MEFCNDLGLFYTCFDFCMHNSISNPLCSGIKLLIAHPVYPAVILLAASASTFFYIELTENELILKNAVCRFWHKAYPYQTITRIKLKNSGGLTQTRLQIINGQKKLGCYVIDLVSPDDYKILIEDLQRKGIVVEVSHNITI